MLSTPRPSFALGQRTVSHSQRKLVSLGPPSSETLGPVGSVIREYGDKMTRAKGFIDNPEKVTRIILTLFEVTKNNQRERERD